MSFFGISDLHLSFTEPVNPNNWENVKQYKPMNIFSDNWQEHYRQVYENWQKTVGPDDIILMPGDFSWAMKLHDVINDLEFLGLLPGTIIGVQGNHDFWWQSISKVRKVLPSNIKLIQNDHVLIGNTAVCGTRGWLCPNDSFFSESDLKIYRRELIRLENSLKSVKHPVEDIIVMMHYMPTNEKHEKSGFIEILEQYKVTTVIYGHLHAQACRFRLPDHNWGMDFHLVSADFVNFTPKYIK
ncbi:metallophosphoesterase [Desulfolucanica intricata]|uniref:metallophosphoesterase n=1 Tax=Desulfolucanica intricata TaxID=1285191 RepID=UPI000832842B|nr:metallophosphoesterase [Desulfolucanica intricata]